MDFIKQWTLNIIYVSVLAAFVKAIAPEGRTKKSVLMAVGLLMLYTIAAPIAGLISSGVRGAADGFKFPEFELAGNMQISDGNAYFDMKNVTGIYKSRIEEQAESILAKKEGIHKAKAKVVIEEDVSSPDFGSIKMLFMSIKLQDSFKKKYNIEPYPTGQGRIVIKAGNNGNTEVPEIIDSSKSVLLEEYKKSLVNALAIALGVDENVVEIKIE